MASDELTRIFSGINNSYLEVLDSVPDRGILLLDRAGIIRFVNRAVTDITRYAPGDLLRRHFAAVLGLSSPDMDAWRATLEQAARTRRYEAQQWLHRKDGNAYLANMIIMPLYEGAGLTGYSCIISSITTDPEITASLKSGEDRYRRLVEQAKDYGIFLLDANGHIISWNEGAQRINGYTAAEILGQHFSIFYPEEDLHKPPYELKVARSTGKFEEEGWRLRKDGTRFWANVVITAVYDDKKNLIGFSKVTRDLTERKKSEQALRESEERYRLLVERLNRANEDLARANEELEQFNSIASHDLQEPLRTTYSFLLMIQKKLDEQADPTLRNYINKAINASIRMKELIVNLLNYSQVSKEEKSYSHIDVSEVIAESLFNLKHSIESAGAVIITRLDAPRITGNRLRLVQLLQNLVSNALKFRGAARPEITITVTEAPDHYQFSVADNGIGIPAEHLQKVFEVFRRLHNPREYPGTGIGLSICKKIVAYHEGRIWVTSEPGKGATFYFTISKQLPVNQ